MTLRLTRRQYADLYGPTTGDRVRLADTELFIRIERDLTTPGEEAKFGGGKVIRDGMGQSVRATRAAGALDVVVTNAVIVEDRKSTRLNSSHRTISYAVFCLKKKTNDINTY